MHKITDSCLIYKKGDRFTLSNTEIFLYKINPPYNHLLKNLLRYTTILQHKWCAKELILSKNMIKNRLIYNLFALIGLFLVKYVSS